MPRHIKTQHLHIDTTSAHTNKQSMHGGGGFHFTRQWMQSLWELLPRGSLRLALKHWSSSKTRWWTSDSLPLWQPCCLCSWPNSHLWTSLTGSMATLISRDSGLALTNRCFLSSASEFLDRSTRLYCGPFFLQATVVASTFFFFFVKSLKEEFKL